MRRVSSNLDEDVVGSGFDILLLDIPVVAVVQITEGQRTERVCIVLTGRNSVRQ